MMVLNNPKNSIIENLEKAIEVQKDTENMHKEILEGKSNSQIHIKGEEEELRKSNLNKSHSSIKSSKNYQQITICRFLSYKQFIFAMISGASAYFIGSFVEPILALQLK
jgi:hypothetical protein